MQPEGGRLAVRCGAGPLPAELAARRRLPPGEYFSLCVEDQGPGISPDLLGRIFDPFFTTKGPGEGTGLGLAVVHGIVVSLGGAVWAESEPGQGARFHVLLPAHAGGEDAPADTEPGDLRGRERILLVDDEPDLLELGRQALAPLGYQVATERSSEAALRALLDAPGAFDLVITDMNMPRLTGLQLAEGLRPAYPDLPVLLITGFSRTVPPDRLETLGAVRLLPKPFSTGELAQAVRQALAPRPGGDA
jgi:CheY-like chemotaxis protein